MTWYDGRDFMKRNQTFQRQTILASIGRYSKAEQNITANELPDIRDENFNRDGG
jgi:hypothetical protein